MRRYNGDKRLLLIILASLAAALIAAVAGQAAVREAEPVLEGTLVGEPPSVTPTLVPQTNGEGRAAERAAQAAFILGAAQITTKQTVNDAVQAITVSSAFEIAEDASGDRIEMPGIVAPDGVAFFLPSLTITPGASFGWRLGLSNNTATRQIVSLNIVGLPEGTNVSAKPLSPENTVVIRRGSDAFLIQLEPGQGEETPNLELLVMAPAVMASGNRDVSIVINGVAW